MNAGNKEQTPVQSRLAVKVDVDTDGGTREGVLPLARTCQRQKVPALFLFSLGPDNMGRSIRRIFQPGFLRKVLRTRVLAHYNFRTLLHGTLLPSPHLGQKHADIMRQVRDMGFEVGVHAYDHYKWQNYAHRWSLEEVRAEFGRAVHEFEHVFGAKPTVAGAPGWQANANSLAVYDEFNLDYASDTRGRSPFLPVVNGRKFKTPQFPTTLPTLDELLGGDNNSPSELRGHYLKLMQAPGDHILTIHAELEGKDYSEWFDDLLSAARKTGVEFFSLGELARTLREKGLDKLPPCEMVQQSLAGRSGNLAVQLPE